MCAQKSEWGNKLQSSYSESSTHMEKSKQGILLTLRAVVGPGIMVMLADTDAGEAQSGPEWGYKMILPQVLLIPILYLVQEVTVRLGLAT